MVKGWSVWIPGVAVALGLAAPGLGAQTPPDTAGAEAPAPDTVPTDTVPGDPEVRLDTLVVDTLPADTLPPEEGEEEGPIRNLPEVGDVVPSDRAAGIWEWDREDLLRNRAMTLADLLAQVPGILSLRGGDLGMPRTLVSPGIGGGGVQVFRDGIEYFPLAGGVPDFSRISLGGLERVRVERNGGGLRVELETFRSDDPRAFSLVEAGTGELDTNVLRGVFVHPDALSGNAGVALDRLDTSGADFTQPGSVTSIWLRYHYVPSERFGVGVELNRVTSDRDTLFLPSELTRTDWTFRGRYRVSEGIVVDGFWARSELDSGDDGEGGVGGGPFRSIERSQIGGRLSVERSHVFGRLSLRQIDEVGLPETAFEGEVGLRDPARGGISGRWSRESWDPGDATTLGVRAWAKAPWGLTFFASLEDYERGVPFLPPPLPGGDEGSSEEDGGQDPDDPGPGDPDDPAPTEGEGPEVQGPSFSSGTGARLGVGFERGDLDLSVAWLWSDPDSVHPLGLSLDRGGLSFPVGSRVGWEGSLTFPLYFQGLRFEGRGQVWEELDDGGEGMGEAWPYFPRRSWTVALSYNRTFLESENLELWLDLGIEGRDGMQVPFPVTGGGGENGPAEMDGGVDGPSPLQTVPELRNGFARIQVRILSVRIFVTWENLSQEVNQDFPGRTLPPTRAIWGVRWTLWN